MKKGMIYRGGTEMNQGRRGGEGGRGGNQGGVWESEAKEVGEQGLWMRGKRGEKRRTGVKQKNVVTGWRESCPLPMTKEGHL